MKTDISIDINFNEDLNLWEIAGREFFDSLEDINKVGEILCTMEQKFETKEKAFDYIFYIEYNSEHKDHFYRFGYVADNGLIRCFGIYNWVLEKSE